MKHHPLENVAFDPVPAYATGLPDLQIIPYEVIYETPARASAWQKFQTRFQPRAAAPLPATSVEPEWTGHWATTKYL